MPQNIDNMGQICYLRDMLTNPGTYAYVEQNGALWRVMEYAVQLLIINLINYIVNIDLDIVVKLFIDSHLNSSN